MIAVAAIFVVIVKEMYAYLLYDVFCFMRQIIQIMLSMNDQTPTETRSILNCRQFCKIKRMKITIYRTKHRYQK